MFYFLFFFSILPSFALQSFSVGKFDVLVEVTTLQIQVTHSNRPNYILWDSLTNSESSQPFLRVGYSEVLHTPIVDGNYQLVEEIQWKSLTQSIDYLVFDTSKEVPRLVIGGLLMKEQENWRYCLVFSSSSLSEDQLSFTVDITSSSTTDPINRLFLSYSTSKDESFHGFGEAFTDFNLKGKRIPILVSEQGVGRGLQPITDALNNGTEGVGGHWYTTYAPKPLYLTNQNRSLVFDNSEIMFIDLTSDSVVEVEVWSLQLRGNILFGLTMRDLIFQITLITGRMFSPPDWSQKGAIVGLEGGTEYVSSLVSLMYSYDIPLAGIWLQDWVGLRHNYDGDRLIWNWEVNPEWYPQWDEMVSSWREKGTRVLTYLNPFFSDPSNYTSSSRHNFFQEGLKNGYFVMNEAGEPYKMHSLSIEFCMLDFTNPSAVEWMKNIIREYSLKEAGSSGWMADFGEYLPFDARLYSGVSADVSHNLYPQQWAQLNYEVLSSLNRTKDVLFFMRSAYTQSPTFNSIFWLGDQLISWDEYDGIQNVLLGALSSGLSGHTITHSDIGGYNSNFDYNYVRDEEILSRWSEFSVFGSGLFRTHIGSSTDKRNFQVYDSESSLLHFKKMSDLYGQVSDYRKLLIEEAGNTGLPLIRPYAMNYGYDPVSWTIQSAYLFGDEFLVSPCMEKGATSVTVYIPANSGTWIHLWGGNVIQSSETGKWLTVPSPIGFPPVFYQKSSSHGHSLRLYCVREGYTEGFSWDYHENKDDSDSSSHHDQITRVQLIIIFTLGGLGSALIFLTVYWRYRNTTQRNQDREGRVDGLIYTPLNQQTQKEGEGDLCISQCEDGESLAGMSMKG